MSYLVSSFDQEADFESDYEYFEECLGKEIENYESRYKTTVEYVSISGTLQLWNGKEKGGAVIKRPSLDILSLLHSYDLEIIVEEDTKDILILAYHHDGMHKFKLEFLTPNKIRNEFPTLEREGNLSLSEAQELASDNRSKVKYTKIFKEYYG